MKRRGFMLVELAVAVLVLAVGILAVFGLAQVGERAAAQVEDETRASLFANDVFDTLRIYSDYFSRSPEPGAWIACWTQLVSGVALPLSGAVDDAVWAFDPDGAGRPEVRADGLVQTNVWVSARAAVDPGGTARAIPEHSLQYRLAIHCPTPRGAVPLLPLDTNAIPRTVWATLHVWSGAFRRNPEPFVFYTHFADHGGLP